MKAIRGWYLGLNPGLRTVFRLFPIAVLGSLSLSVLFAAYIDSPFVSSIAIPVILCAALFLIGLDLFLSSGSGESRAEPKDYR